MNEENTALEADAPQIDALASTTKKKSTAKKSTSTRKKTSTRRKTKSTTSTIESAIRREITRQTGIPTTASGIKNKIGRAIVDFIVGLFTGKKAKSSSSKKGDIVADI